MGEAAGRGAIALRVRKRLDPSSQSMCAIVDALCEDAETSLDALRSMDAVVQSDACNVETWDAIISAVGKHALLKALLTLVRECSTGPITAYAITEAHANLMRRRVEEAASVVPSFDDSARLLQLQRQAGLVALVDGVLTSPHEARV